MRVLQILKTGYRATLEEQDDTIVWLVHAMRGAGADLAVVLSGACINYGLPSQDASGLRFGARIQRHAPALQGDLESLIKKSVPVYYIAEEAQERGIDSTRLLPHLQRLSRAALPALMAEYDQVWAW